MAVSCSTVCLFKSSWTLMSQPCQRVNEVPFKFGCGLVHSVRQSQFRIWFARSQSVNSEMKRRTPRLCLSQSLYIPLSMSGRLFSAGPRIRHGYLLTDGRRGFIVCRRQCLKLKGRHSSWRDPFTPDIFHSVSHPPKTWLNRRRYKLANQNVD